MVTVNLLDRNEVSAMRWFVCWYLLIDSAVSECGTVPDTHLATVTGVRKDIVTVLRMPKMAVQINGFIENRKPHVFAKCARALSILGNDHQNHYPRTQGSRRACVV